ncbi:hypothetical protein LguiB_021683 [Lonicera macranthoides]
MDDVSQNAAKPLFDILSNIIALAYGWVLAHFIPQSYLSQDNIMAIVKAHEASSSTCYDVFLSFRGEDTRKTFTYHFYTALVQQRFHTFKDNDEIEKGEYLKSELQKAIRQSKISIVVISKDYASSTWCLDELVMILEQRRISGHVVLPVFYDVDPSQVRKQTGRTADAFA